MKIVGLTGSIGMGKTETAGMFRDLGIPVFDADAVVHQLQAPGGRAISQIKLAFPSVIDAGVLDRQKLGAIVFADAAEKKKLEAIMHPMVGEERAAFFSDAEKVGTPFVVVDVPLLFETGGNAACDKVIVVSAPESIQRSRVLARAGMTAEKFEHILSKQTPDADKRAGADYIIETDKGLEHARAHVQEIVDDLTGQYGR